MSKYKSRSEVPEKYKWDLSDFYKNEEEFNKELEETKKRIIEEEEFRGCTKNGNKLYEFLKFDNETECMIENLCPLDLVKYYN